MSYKHFVYPFVNFVSFRSIKLFNTILNKVILERVKDKKSIGVQLSGGKDTRAILSVLLHSGVKIGGLICIVNETEHNKEDLRISSQISRDLRLPMVKVPECTEFFSVSRKGTHGFDVIFSGYLMTEILDRGFFARGNQILEAVEQTQKILDEIPELCVPMLDVRCLVASTYIPFYLKYSGIVNRKVIQLNYPDLLKYNIHSLPYDIPRQSRR
jgi:hypothetical protein